MSPLLSLFSSVHSDCLPHTNYCHLVLVNLLCFVYGISLCLPLYLCQFVVGAPCILWNQCYSFLCFLSGLCFGFACPFSFVHLGLGLIYLCWTVPVLNHIELFQLHLSPPVFLAQNVTAHTFRFWVFILKTNYGVNTSSHTVVQDRMHMEIIFQINQMLFSFWSDVGFPLWI